MKQFCLVVLLLVNLSAFAYEDLCTLTPGHWKGWVKLKVLKTKASGTVKHLSGNRYEVSGKIPDLGLKGSYQYTCENGVAHHSKLRKPVYFVKKGNGIKVDYSDNGKKGHFDHTIGKLSFFDMLKEALNQ